MSGPLIDRTNYNLLVDESAPGANDGSLWTKTQIKNVIMDAVDALIAKTYALRICEGRLTLTAATPVTSADVLAATTLRFTPYGGSRIALYDGSAWNVRSFSEFTIAVPATTSTMYDVWVFDNAGTPTLEVLAWTNDTTRATALTTQDGVLVKTGALTRRYVGSFRTTTASGQTESSSTKRYVWNYYNRVRLPLARVEATASWNYTTSTWRQANAAAANQVDVVVGVAEALLELVVSAVASNTNVGVFHAVGIGEDVTNALMANCREGLNASQVASTAVAGAHAIVRHYPAIGRHFYPWLERSVATGTTTWYGTSGFSNSVSGMHGSIDG